MPFFDLRIQWVESSDFGPKSDDLGHRILKYDFLSRRICKIGLHKQAHPFSDRKIKIRSSESDRIINDLKSDFIPSGFAKSDYISRPIFFSDRKIKIRSSESDRVINGLRLILMRIRFRASGFGQIAKTKFVRTNRNRLLARSRIRRWCSGHSFICLWYVIHH